MDERGSTGPEGAQSAHEEEHPRGTLFLMLLFLVMIVAMWGYLYLLLLARG